MAGGGERIRRGGGGGGGLICYSAATVWIQIACRYPTRGENGRGVMGGTGGGESNVEGCDIRRPIAANRRKS